MLGVELNAHLFLPAALGLIAGLAVAAPAVAHPHIFIDARAVVVFDTAGAVSEIRHSWTFDAAFSAWTVQGLDTDADGVTSPEELQDLAAENLSGLAQYGFYTFAGEGEKALDFIGAPDPAMRFEDGQVTLDFAVRPEPAYSIGDTLELAVNDPEYYVAITFADANAVTLENAPAGCAARLEPPQEMPMALADQLFALGPDVTALPPDLAAAVRGVQGAIHIHCPAGAQPAATGLDAVNTVAAARPAPFGGPPPEPGLNLPRTGFFGWLAEQQRSFYAALTASLGQLKADANAFWVLGGLSFLYGVLHAAGPGHGKVVIGSYVLANEAEVRRGVALSFAAAMVQALVAIGFVLVAAMALQMTSLAMGDAAHWIGIGSYALVALLGFWLLARKLFGWGHHHDHGHADLAQKAHAYLHADEHHPAPSVCAGPAHHHHHHVVIPSQTGGSWREQLGVVLAVGARPCSGALVVLVFALSQGLLAAGIAAVLMMGLGTALTTGALAALAVSAKGFARKLGGNANAATARLLWWTELAGAAMVFGFGVLLLAANL